MDPTTPYQLARDRVSRWWLRRLLLDEFALDHELKLVADHELAVDHHAEAQPELLTAFRNMAAIRRGNWFVKVTYRSAPFFPQQLPDIDEENFVRDRYARRASCASQWSAIRPVSGPLDVADVALDASSAESGRPSAEGMSVSRIRASRVLARGHHLQGFS